MTKALQTRLAKRELRLTKKIAKELERTNALDHARNQLDIAKSGTDFASIEAAMYWREVIVRILAY